MTVTVDQIKRRIPFHVVDRFIFALWYDIFVED